MPLEIALAVLAFVLVFTLASVLLLAPATRKRWHRALQDRYLIFKVMRKHSHYEISADIHGQDYDRGCVITAPSRPGDGFDVYVASSDAPLPRFMEKIRKELLKRKSPESRSPNMAMDARGEDEFSEWERIMKTSETARITVLLLNRHFASGV